MSRDDNQNIPPELRSALEQASQRDDGSDAEAGAETDADEAPSERDPGWDAVWALLGRAAPPDDALPDADDTWAEVRAHVEDADAGDEARRSGDRRPRRPAARRSGTRRRLWRWGSAVALALALVAVAVWWTRPVAVTAPAGATVTHTLPDGSTVELNGDSRLTYPRTFSTISVLQADRRAVRLRGEAYFEVESGGRPFVVHTPSVRVEVLGTAFSVRSRPGEAADAHVALAEGRLRVTAPDRTGPQRTLRPGQAATLDADGRLTAVRDTSLDRLLAWRQGGFAVTAQPLPTLARALERRFGRSIRLGDSIDEATRSAPLTLYYTRNAALDTILHDVCLARGLTYRPTATGYVLAPADDPSASPSR